MSVRNVVTDVVDRGLCSGCGVCVGLCPQGALQMATLPSGDLVASCVGECLERCNLCLSVCPFAAGVHDPRQDNTELFGPQAQSAAVFHENLGWHRRCFVGFSDVDEHRSRGASGGLATWCLEMLLRDGLIERAAVVRFSGRSDGPLFEFVAAQSVDEIREAAGSAYHPVAISDLLQIMIAEPECRWAVVGVPCLCLAVRRASSQDRRIGSSVRYLLGLACGMLQNTMYTEMLLAKRGMRPEDVGHISYRESPVKGPASNYGFTAVDTRGCRRSPIWYRGLPYFLGRNGYFRCNACNYCKDVFAEAGDACFTDAWLPEYVAEPQGASIVVVRSEQLEELLLDGLGTGVIELESIPADRVAASQRAQVRRKQQLIAMRLPREGATGNGPQATYVSWGDRLDWRFQQRTQERSKRAWRRYGRRWGTVAFWLAMADVAVVQTVLWRLLPRVKGLARGLLRRILTVLKLR